MTAEEFNQIIEQLKVDLKIYSEMIQEVSEDMRKEHFTEYPVFIASEHEVKLGELILDKEDHAATFSIYATTMEELLERKILLPAKQPDFVKTYKNPSQFMCVMLLTASVASFVFVPYTAK
jgi:hypothetical protein